MKAIIFTGFNNPAEANKQIKWCYSNANYLSLHDLIIIGIYT